MKDTSRVKKAWIVNWPYDNCRVFTLGELVYYVLRDSKMYFRHPVSGCWTLSNRPNILKDTCSALPIDPLTIPFELPKDDFMLASGLGEPANQEPGGSGTPGTGSCTTSPSIS